VEATRGDAGLSAVAGLRAPRWASRFALAAALTAPAAGCGREEAVPAPADAYRERLADASKEYDDAAVEAIYEVRDSETDEARLKGLRNLVAATDAYVARLETLRPPPEAAVAHADLQAAYAGLARQARAAEQAVRRRGGFAAANEVRKDPATVDLVSRARDAEDRLERAGFGVRSVLQ
jgi:hypothetical protein